MIYKASFITPIFYKNEKSLILQRAKNLINSFANLSEFELIIADFSPKKELKSDAKNIKILSDFTQENTFNVAKAKNKAAFSSTAKFLVFFDVDMIIDINLIEKYLQKLAKNDEKFQLFSFFYLSKKISKKLAKKYKNGILCGEKAREFQEQKREIFDRFLQGNFSDIDSLSMSSSAMIIDKDAFFDLGGFDESFAGHGGEDLEFLHRLLQKFSPYSKNDDYFINEAATSLANLKGFRKYFALHSLNAFMQGDFWLHLWHDRKLFDTFYLKKSLNQDSLLDKIRKNSYDLADKLPCEFEQMLQNYSQIYPALRQEIKQKKLFKNKIRKIFITFLKGKQ